MTDDTSPCWRPYIVIDDDGSVQRPIWYTATDNTSLLWNDTDDGTRHMGLDWLCRRPAPLRTSAPPDTGDASAGAGSEESDIRFLHTLLNQPVVTMPNLFVFPHNPVEGTDDIDNEQFVLTQRRLKKQSAPQSDDTAEEEDDNDSSDGTRDTQADQLLEDKPYIGGRFVCCTTNLAGIIYNKTNSDEEGRDIRLSISSRFSKRTDGTPAPLWEDWFLAYMTQQVMHINLLDIDFAHGTKNAWHELLMCMFPIYLDAAMEKGIFREYVRRKYNDTKMRGRFDAARHIRDNTPFLGTIAYSTRIYDADNPVTELIRHTIEYILASGSFGKTLLNNNADTVNHVREIRNVTPRYNQYERSAIIDRNIRKPVRHVLYREYRELQRLCIAILAYRGMDSDALKQHVHGVLFDCSWLWEEYIGNLLTAGGILAKHPRNKTHEGIYHLMKQVDSEGNPIGRVLGSIYPDYLLSLDSKYQTVADAKYKPLGNVGGRDYMQVLAYMIRFNTRNGMYLHPYVPPDKESDDTEKPISTHRYQILDGFEREDGKMLRADHTLYKIGLNVSVDDADTYRAYQTLMSQRENRFVKAITSIMRDDSWEDVLG